MTVDRSGTAWILDVTGHIYNADTTTAACTETLFDPTPLMAAFHAASLPWGAYEMELAWALDAPSPTLETRDVGGGETGTLATIDPSTQAVNVVGSFTGMGTGAGCDLTGNRAGDRFALFAVSPTSIGQIDKSNASVRIERRNWLRSTSTESDRSVPR